jgi:hypothetical protein
MTQGIWEPVLKKKLIGFVAGSCLFLIILLGSEPGFVIFLDHANLVFHEAGHPIIGLFSARLEPYGGTIGQLFFPALLIVAFWRRGEVFGVATCSIWFFENWLNIARYAADARSMELPLVGGGDHDWNIILSRWDLLQADLQIAAVLRILAWLGMAGACVFVAWRGWQDRNRQGATYPTLDSLNGRALNLHKQG